MNQLLQNLSDVGTLATLAASPNPILQEQAAKEFSSCDNSERKFQIYRAFAEVSPNFAEEQLFLVKSPSGLIDLLTRSYSSSDKVLIQIANNFMNRGALNCDHIRLCLASGVEELETGASKYFASLRAPDSMTDVASATAATPRPIEVFHQLTNTDKKRILRNLVILDESMDKCCVRGLLAGLTPDYACSLMVFALTDATLDASRLTALNDALTKRRGELTAV